MRIAVGGIFHETNTYANSTIGLTDAGDFRQLSGDDIVHELAHTRTYVGGMLDEAETLGIEAIPTFFARATPSGSISASAYQFLLNQLLDSIRTAMPIDGVALALHGAGAADGIDDIESDICRHLRGIVGARVPISVSLDLHANFSDEMADVFDVAFGVHSYPHTDMYERGREAVATLPALACGDIKPFIHVEHLPVLMLGIPTAHPLIMKCSEICADYEKRPDVIDCTLFHGFPFVDAPGIGVTVVVTTNDDPPLAKAIGRRVGSVLWAEKESLQTEPTSAKDAILEAQKINGRPVVINDLGDNPGGGAPGDATHLLREMIEMDVTQSAFGCIYDPEVAVEAHAAGEGQVIDVKLGGKHDEIHGAPIEARARIKKLTSGRYRRTGVMGRGELVELGLTARLEIGGIDVIVTARRHQTSDTDIFDLHGIDVRTCRIVAVKSTTHFRAAFDGLAAGIIGADCPGLTSARVAAFPRIHEGTPLWPLDATADYPPRDQDSAEST